MRLDTVEALRDAIEGRRVISVRRRIYEPEHLLTDFPVLYLDDGSEVVLLDGDGFSPLVEIEKPSWTDPLLWEGDDG